MKFKAIIIALLLFTMSNLFGKSDNLKMFTKQYPPYNMMIDGKLTDISDLNQYKIGAVPKDIGGILLLSNGIKKEDTIDMCFHKMKKNRIDMSSYAIEATFANRKAKGFDMSKYEVIHVLKEAELYFAFNKNTDDSIINKWQKTLDKIKGQWTIFKNTKKILI